MIFSKCTWIKAAYLAALLFNVDCFYAESLPASDSQVTDQKNDYELISPTQSDFNKKIYLSTFPLSHELATANLDFVLETLNYYHILFNKQELGIEERRRIETFHLQLGKIRDLLNNKALTPEEFNDEIIKLIATIEDPHVKGISLQHLYNANKKIEKDQDSVRATVGLYFKVWEGRDNQKVLLIDKANPEIFGEEYRDLQSKVVEKINGQNIEDYLREHLYPYFATTSARFKFEKSVKYLGVRPLRLFPVLPQGKLRLELRGMDEEIELPWLLRSKGKFHVEQKNKLERRKKADPFHGLVLPRKTSRSNVVFIRGMPFLLFKNSDRLAALFHVPNFSGGLQACHEDKCHVARLNDFVTALNHLSQLPIDIEDLYIDLRTNPGGRLNIAQELLQAVSKEDFEAPLMTATINNDFLGIPNRFLELAEEAGQQSPHFENILMEAKSIAGNRPDGEGGTITFPNGSQEVLEGKASRRNKLNVYFLIGPGTGSAAEIIARKAKELGFPVIGQNTVGAYGAISDNTATTPSTHLVIRLAVMGSPTDQPFVTPTEGWEIERMDKIWREIEEINKL